MYLLNFGVYNRFGSFWPNFLFFNFVLISRLNLEKFWEPSLVRSCCLIFSCLLLLQSLSKQGSLFLWFLRCTVLLKTFFFSSLNYRLNKGKCGIHLLFNLLFWLWLSSGISSSLINYLHAWFIIFCELLLKLLKTLLFELSQGVTSTCVLLHIFIKFTINFLLFILHFIIN